MVILQAYIIICDPWYGDFISLSLIPWDSSWKIYKVLFIWQIIFSIVVMVQHASCQTSVFSPQLDEKYDLFVLFYHVYSLGKYTEYNRYKTQSRAV